MKITNFETGLFLGGGVEGEAGRENLLYQIRGGPPVVFVKFDVLR